VSESTETRTLLRLARRRFHNFSEATSEVLDALAEALPGAIALGRLDSDERVHRLMEARGGSFAGLERGSALPLAGDQLDTEFLRTLGVQAWVSAPLDMSDGSIAGVLCALDRRADVYQPEHEALLRVAARLLGHEWESVELRSELRRLRLRDSAGPTTDMDTGLPNREGFLQLLDHEWALVERGTVESVLVACRVGSGGVGTHSRARLALKQAAEALTGSVRATDRVGRVDEATLAAILIGCPLEDAPAFVARFIGGLERVTSGGSPIDVSCGVQPLAAAGSAEEALGLAEAAAAAPGRARQDLVPQPAIE
jgi:GGDEF domain-containing protein